MKRLLVLWDPENPQVPVGAVVRALGRQAEVRELTFQGASHRTMPNGTFTLASLGMTEGIDGLLWIEGGPYPHDLSALSCPKAAWLVNTHHEPTLLEDLRSEFDILFSASLGDSSNEGGHWLPLAAGEGAPSFSSESLSILVDDPKPPAHAAVEKVLRELAPTLPPTEEPVVFCLGQGGRVHRKFMDSLRGGAAVVVDPESDLRGLAQPGDHLEVFPSLGELEGFTRTLMGDSARLSRLAARGPEIVRHLHTPTLRARQICEGIWPSYAVLGGQEAKPTVSVLVTCYKYLRRLKYCLESLARQALPPGALEIVVADPESPDGLGDYLREFALRHPHLRVIRLPLEPGYHRNRGLGINRAFDASQGRVILSIDGDIIFPPCLVGELVRRVQASPKVVFGVRRSFIGREPTERILKGEIDPFLEFDRLAMSEGDGEEKGFVGVLGYCQAVERSAFARARYPEEFDVVNQSDIVFVERLGKYAGVEPRFLEEHAVLHLWHPRNWNGTQELL